jgi:hypothetical protein
VVQEEEVVMKTIKITRTIRREVDGVFVYIGPDGIAFREKHSKHRFPMTWRQVWVRAMESAVAEEREKPLPLVEVRPLPDDPKQVLMFPELDKKARPWDATLDYRSGDKVLFNGKEVTIGTLGVNHMPLPSSNTVS